MRLLILLLLTGCAVTSATEPVDTAAIDVAIAEAIYEERKPPELPNDFPPKTNSSETPNSSNQSPGVAQPSGGHSSPCQDAVQPLFQVDLPTLCITIAGVDYDLMPILKSYVRPWTWPGTDEQSLRDHLHSETHKVGGIDELSFAEIKRLHAALHERERRAVQPMVPPAPKAVPSPTKATPAPVYRSPSSCPGGVCPQPQYRQWSQPRYGLFGRRLR